VERTVTFKVKLDMSDAEAAVRQLSDQTVTIRAKGARAAGSQASGGWYRAQALGSTEAAPATPHHDPDQARARVSDGSSPPTAGSGWGGGGGAGGGGRRPRDQFRMRLQGLSPEQIESLGNVLQGAFRGGRGRVSVGYTGSGFGYAGTVTSQQSTARMMGSIAQQAEALGGAGTLTLRGTLSNLRKVKELQQAVADLELGAPAAAASLQRQQVIARRAIMGRGTPRERFAARTEVYDEQYRAGVIDAATRAAAVNQAYADTIGREHDRQQRAREVAQQRYAMAGRRFETPGVRLGRELAENNRAEREGIATPEQAQERRGQLIGEYEQSRRDDAEQRVEKYRRARMVVQLEQAQIQRSMSYIGMAAAQAVQGFVQLGIAGEKNTQSLLQAVVRVQGAFNLFRGTTLGLSAIQSVGVKVQRERWALGRQADLYEKYIAGGGEDTRTARQQLQQQAYREAQEAVLPPVGPSLVGRVMGAGAAVRGAYAAAPIATTLGVVAGGALAAGGAVVAGGVAYENIAAKLQAGRIQSAFEGRASLFSGRERQWQQTGLIYTREHEQWQRQMEIEQRHAGLAGLQAGQDRIPGPENIERSLVEARVRREAAERELTEAQYRRAEVEKQGAEDAAAADKRQSAARNKAQADLLRHPGGWWSSLVRGPRDLSLNDVAEQHGLPRGYGSVPILNIGLLPWYANESERRRKALQQAAGLGESTGEITKRDSRLADAARVEQEKLVQQQVAVREEATAERELAQSRLGIARRRISIASEKSGEAARGVYGLDMGLGQLSEREYIRVGDAVRISQAGVDPRLMPEEYKQMIRSGLAGEEEQQRLAAAEYRLGQERRGVMGVGGREQRRLEFQNQVLARSLGIDINELEPNPDMLQQLGINPQNPGEAPRFREMIQNLQALNIDTSQFDNPFILSQMQNNPAEMQRLQLQLRNVGAQLRSSAGGFTPESVGLAPSLAGEARPGERPVLNPQQQLPNVLRSLEDFLQADKKERQAKIDSEASVVRSLVALDHTLRRIDERGIRLNIQGQNAGAAAGLPAGTTNIDTRQMAQGG